MSRENIPQNKPEFNGNQPPVESPELSTAKNPSQWFAQKQGIFCGIAIGMLLTLVGTRLISSESSVSAEATAPVTVAQTPAKSVTVAEAVTTSVNRTLKATGSVDALEMISVLSQASGLQIEQVLVDEGDVVSRGQLLVKLDNALLQAQLVQAQAEMAQAEARLAELRAGSRAEEIGVARERVSSISADVERAKSELDLARKRVQRNQGLEAQGAIARDRLDEILNEERIQKSNLDQAQARLREAKEELAERQAGPRPEVITQAEAQLARAKGQVQLVSEQLKQTRVLAPVSGKIASRDARVGNVTSNSQNLFNIIENGRLELRLEVPETQLPEIRPGQTVEISSDVDRNLQLTGKVREIDPVVDETSRKATIKVDLPGVSSLQPGMFLRGTIVTSATTGLSIPFKAILPQSDGSAIVYRVLSDGTVEAQSVEVGELMPNEQVEIKNGLQAGDRLVIKGKEYLSPGDRVDIIQ